ncbi:MAG: ATP synthase F0 subunit B [Synechococcales bacterium]|nr:ATP synthase F0 subunit B [Synechococcales bacterium]
MLRRDPDPMTLTSHPLTLPSEPVKNGLPYSDASSPEGMDIQRELSRMEEMILDSPRIPLSRRTLIDEEQVLDQLELIQLALPSAFQEALNVIRQKEAILLEAEQYAQDLVDAAERRAAQILDEMGLMRQAEIEIAQARQQVQQECEAMRDQVRAEIDQMHLQAQQDLEEMRQMAIAECRDVERGADAYADRVLGDMERQLNEMMRVIRNGRQQLRPESPPSHLPPPRPGEFGGSRSYPPRPGDRHR